eukprot:TRINITY_DN11312_c0_g1_i3.p1 TRINITY_DN11312_c0_g1~~TRINITY_DN11312_c0_g1_i3.p1  ORF type:complete len:366 (+),score=72.46 TRINITY_DN11312_c0_g1_i3:181-1278(+)
MASVPTRQRCNFGGRHPAQPTRPSRRSYAKSKPIHHHPNPAATYSYQEKEAEWHSYKGHEAPHQPRIGADPAPKRSPFYQPPPRVLLHARTDVLGAKPAPGAPLVAYSIPIATRTAPPLPHEQEVTESMEREERLGCEPEFMSPLNDQERMVRTTDPVEEPAPAPGPEPEPDPEPEPEPERVVLEFEDLAEAWGENREQAIRMVHEAHSLQGFDDGLLTSMALHCADDRPWSEELPGPEELEVTIRLVEAVVAKCHPSPEEMNGLFCSCLRNGVLSLAQHLQREHGLSLSERFEYELPPLFHAVRNFKKGAILWLLEEGQDVHEVSDEGLSVYQYAVSCCSGSDEWLRERFPEIEQATAGTPEVT